MGERDTFVGQLADMIVRQEARRVIRGLWSQHELDELGAIKVLAAEAFGSFGFGGVVEMEHVMGVRTTPIGIGFFLEPERRGPRSGRSRWDVQGGKPQRRTRIVFWGESHRELTDQVNLWRSVGCPRFWEVAGGPVG